MGVLDKMDSCGPGSVYGQTVRLVTLFKRVGGTYQFGAKHFTEDSVHDVVL